MIKIRTTKEAIYSGNNVEEKRGILEFRVKRNVAIDTGDDSYKLTIETFVVTEGTQTFEYINEEGEKYESKETVEKFKKILYHIVGGVFAEEQVNQLSSLLVSLGVVTEEHLKTPVLYNKLLIANASIIEIARLSKEIEQEDLQIISY